MEKNELFIIHGKDIREMAIRLAEEADLAALIGARGKRIGLKPNLVVARPASGGATTHPEIAAGLIAYLKENGFDNITILEGAWAGASTSDAFTVCGFRKLAKETGVRLIDTKTDKARICDCKGMDIEICESALAIDFMINLPVLKGHCQTRVTCALKNNKGIIPDSEKRRFHSLGLTKPIAHLNTVARSDFILVDGICGDLDFEEGGNPVYAGRLAAARDPVLCDAWAASEMGYALSDIPYIGLAEKLGVGSADIRGAKIRKLEGGKAKTAGSGGDRSPASGRNLVSRLEAYTAADSACSDCYAALISALSRLSPDELARLKEKICVGQAYRGKKGNIGVGNCTAAFRASCAGCPPSGEDILAFLRVTSL